MITPPTKTRTNFRVVVYPNEHLPYLPSSTFSANDLDSACLALERDIRRHIDGIRGVDTFWDTEVKCAHCGYKWQPDDAGCNGCCDEHVAEWESENQAVYV